LVLSRTILDQAAWAAVACGMHGETLSNVRRNDDAHAHLHLSMLLEDGDHVCDELHVMCTLRRFALR